ncbi:ccr4 associated factor [Malassezia obtusa]|uniref:Ccr4 associated factor n=1 Tax=Malassezia obtusa TaxID=76774 RepID=A0AAF0E193_9BASI|nr:ccr4 associated factor [Malassezia obtusa]
MLSMLARVARSSVGATGTRCFASAAAQVSAAKLPRRSIIALEGRDTLKFLQGTITNNIKALEEARAAADPPQSVFYAAFLTPQGRMIADALMYLVRHTEEPAVLVEVDTNIVSELLKFIKRFKLRSKLRLTDVSSEWEVHHVWGPSAHQAINTDEINRLRGFAARDIRAPLMGWRVLVPAGMTRTSPVAHTASFTDSVAEASFEAYTAHRMLCGVPEGADELANGSSLPLESCVDYMHGAPEEEPEN